MIKAEKLSFSYEENKVLNDINFNLKKGELSCLLGANGSGKTTIIKCLNGINKYNSGHIKIDNINLSQLNNKKIARKVSMVPQEHNSTFSYKAIDIVIMGITPYLSFGSQANKKDYNRAKEILKKLGISNLAQRNYNKLSGGERQLVLIARAIMQDTDYMLLDEPSSHLDFKNKHLIMRELKKLSNRGNGIITALHDPNLAIKYCDKVIIIKAGEILEQGKTADVMNAENLSRAYDSEIVINEISNEVEIIFKDESKIKDVKEVI